MNRKQHENVQALAEYVRTKVTDEEFDIDVIVAERGCGTVGCLIHHATRALPEYGYRTMPSKAGEEGGDILHRRRPKLREEPFTLSSVADRLFGFFIVGQASPFGSVYYTLRGIAPTRLNAAQALLDVAEEQLRLQGGVYTDE